MLTPLHLPHSHPGWFLSLYCVFAFHKASALSSQDLVCLDFSIPSTVPGKKKVLDKWWPEVWCLETKVCRWGGSCRIIIPNLCRALTIGQALGQTEGPVSWITQLVRSTDRVWACHSDPEFRALLLRGTASHFWGPPSHSLVLSQILLTSVYFMTCLSPNDCQLEYSLLEKAVALWDYLGCLSPRSEP